MRITVSLTATLVLFVVLDSVPVAQAQETALSAQTILAHTDSVLNAPKDQIYGMELVLIEEDGTERGRMLKMWQKGSEMRLAKFLEPAEVRNVGFLSLPDDVMYIYLPAFKRVRRIAAHVRNQRFAGTDFSYDDMGTIEYAEDYTASLEEETGESYVLLLIPKAGAETDYGQLKMWVSKITFYPSRTEYYDRGDNPWKVMERREVIQREGYWIALEIVMQDLKANHSTRMRLVDIEFDTGIPDEIFTQRFLTRRP